MNAVCTHCGELIAHVPIIGLDERQQTIDFYRKLVVHLNQKHGKFAGELLKATLAKIAGMEVTLLNLAGLSQFSSSDPNWEPNKLEAFGQAEKIFEEFRPKVKESTIV